MSSRPDQVIVTPAGHSILASHAAEVHHRDFPEVRGEGDSPEDAAARLADQLARTLDSAPSAWRREWLEQAIEDVRAFARGEEA
jgi:hypothetical protein